VPADSQKTLTGHSIVEHVKAYLESTNHGISHSGGEDANYCTADFRWSLKLKALKACTANGPHPAEMDTSEIKKQKSEFLP